MLSGVTNLNYYDIKDTVQNLVAHVGELDKKVKEHSRLLGRIEVRLEELEAEAYDADKVKSAIKELREELLQTQKDPEYRPYFIVKLEDSQ